MRVHLICGRCLRPALALAALCVIATLTGCARSSSSDWAQNAPTISPSDPSASLIDLGFGDDEQMTQLPVSAQLGAGG